MKRIFSTMVLCVAMLFTMSVSAQVKAPAPSPSSKVMQTVGLTDITLEFSRPSMKGRTIFGDLVPYNKMWRTGANKNSMVTFSDDVMISGSEVKAGTYAIFATPTASSWKIDIYSDTENWGTPKEWDATKVAATLNARTMKTGSAVETFNIAVENISNGSAELVISWENTKAAIPVSVPTDKKVMASIDRTMNGPTGGDYYTAGRYFKDSGKDYKKALEYITKSIEMNGEKFWMVRQKALAYEKLGMVKEAIATAEKSMMLAKEAGNEDYVRNNEKSIAKWKAMK